MVHSGGEGGRAFLVRGLLAAGQTRRRIGIAEGWLLDEARARQEDLLHQEVGLDRSAELPAEATGERHDPDVGQQLHRGREPWKVLGRRFPQVPPRSEVRLPPQDDCRGGAFAGLWRERRRRWAETHLPRAAALSALLRSRSSRDLRCDRLVPGAWGVYGF